MAASVSAFQPRCVSAGASLRRIVCVCLRSRVSVGQQFNSPPHQGQRAVAYRRAPSISRPCEGFWEEMDGSLRPRAKHNLWQGGSGRRRDGIGSTLVITSLKL